jgi:hypothetical protein
VSLSYLTPLKLWTLLKKTKELPPLSVPDRELERFVKAMKQCKYREVRQQKCVGIFRYPRMQIIRTPNTELPGYTSIVFKLIDFYNIDESL